MMGERLRLCGVCDTPSPGPTKRLYYQHRVYGPFFPLLEDQRRTTNSCLFSGGRVLVCTGCASHLLRQWATYEKNWVPLERRSYTLLSEERMARKAEKESLTKVSMATNGDRVELNDQESRSWKKAASEINTRQRALKAFNHETSSDKGNSSNLNERLSAFSFNSEDSGPFHRAVKKVSKQNIRILTEYNEANKQSEPSSSLETLERQEQWNGQERIPVTSRNGTFSLPPKKRQLALWNLTSEDIRSQVREELQENIDVMIRKVAEIQHFENMRKCEQELKDATERICRAQKRDSDIDSLCETLKSQLNEELMFRDTLKVLKENAEETDVSEDKKVMSLEAPPGNILERQAEKQKIKPKMSEVPTAKKAGKEWKSKSVRKKIREKSGQNTENSLALVPCPTDESPSTSGRNDSERITSATRKLDSVLRELEKEREWRKTTESVIAQQREMIEDLRSGIQIEVQRLIDEQNKRFRDIKTNLTKSPNQLPRHSSKLSRTSPNGLSRPSPYKNPYSRLDSTSSVDHDATRDNGENVRSRGRRRHRKGRSRDDWSFKTAVPSGVHSKKYDDDESVNDDDISDDSDDENPPPATPEFYVQ